MRILNSEQDPCFTAEKNLGMNQYDMEFINDVFDTAFMNGGLTERLSGRKSHCERMGLLGEASASCLFW